MEDFRKTLHERLTRFGQEHVLAHWDELSDPQRQQLADQIEQLDLAALRALFSAGSAAEDWAEVARRALAPPAIRLDRRDQAIAPEQAQARGLEALSAGHVGVLLVAGGQGTRLGFDQPKGTYAIGPVSGSSLLQILIEKILARSRMSGMRIPLYLMTSPATHEPTLAYLSSQENFGLPADDLRVFCQGTMPAVDAATGRLLLEEKHALAVSPDGHGGMLAALAASGCLADIRGRGLRQLFYCQVDNPLVQMCDPEFLGYHLLAGAELSTQVVCKHTSRDKVGNVVAIDGKLRIIEYSDLNPLDDEIVERRTAEGQPVFWAGNTAIHVFDVALLERTAQSGGGLPFHAAKKAVPHIDAAGRRVQPREPNADQVRAVYFRSVARGPRGDRRGSRRGRGICPGEERARRARDTPESVRSQMIALHARWLRAAECEIAPGVAVEISPTFAQNAEEVAAQIRPGLVVTQPRYFC